MGLFDHLRSCGCWYPTEGDYGRARKSYLPQVGLQSSTKILSTTSRTELRQTFINSSDKNLNEVQYTFPLYDGVSVVAFKCTVASRTIVGVVKEKQQARTDYKEAIARGETAGLLEQIPEASDVFSTTIGNVPANETIYVHITYLGELKHDAETDGSRFTIPTMIAPRYGEFSPETARAVRTPNAHAHDGIKVSVEVELEKGSVVRGLQSPSHPIAVTMGRMSTMHEDAFENNCASASLTLESTELGKDFVIVVLSKTQGIPQAMLETHDTISDQRALMTTLVPKFNIPNIVPEIVFVVDRSGSMGGKIPTVISALKIFLKSLPVNGIKFNVCSFGSRYSFLFNRSKTYDQSSLDEALQHINTFSANFGGTEMLQPVKQTCEQRYKDMPLEVMLLTDGEIWNQQALFDFINEQENARFFSLGIGSGASSGLVEGIARAGGGFAQFVDENEKMDKRVVRMLKAALTPHITDYSLSLNYEGGEDADFEMIESVSTDDAETIAESEPNEVSEKKPISLFDPSAEEQDLPATTPASRYSAVPAVKVPAALQAPHKIPALHPFTRTTVYLLLSPSARTSNPSSLTLRGTSPSGPLELTIPIQILSSPGVTIHQLAAKKASHELEQGRGWLIDLKAADGRPVKEKHEGNWDLIVERECVRLGTTFQVAGKYTSFVAVEAKQDADRDGNDDEYEVIPERESLKPQAPVRNASSATGGSLFGGAAAVSAYGIPPPPAAPAMRQRSAMQAYALPPPPPLSSTGAASLFAGADMRQGPQMSATYIPPAPGGFGAGGGGLFGNPSSNTTNSGPGVLREPNVPPASAMRSFENEKKKAKKPALEAQRAPASGGGSLFGSSSSTARASQNQLPPPPPPQRQVEMEADTFDFPADQSFNLDFSTLDNNDVLENFDFDKYVSTSSYSFNVESAMVGGDFSLDTGSNEEFSAKSPANAYSPASPSYSPVSPPVAPFKPVEDTQDLASLSDADKMHKLIEMQRFDGSWAASEALWKVLVVYAAVVRAKDGALADVEEDVLATVAAVAWLEAKMGGEEEVWEMVVEKAKAWMAAKGVGEGVVEGVKALF